MAQGKQAKILTCAQVKAVLNHLEGTRHPERNRVIFMLSVKAGLRAKEISAITWPMVTDGTGKIADAIQLEDKAAKGTSGRTIPMNKELRVALVEYQTVANRKVGDFIITSERASRMTPGSVAIWFRDMYIKLGYEGCSSHSGRRTFVTNGAKRVVEAGGSLRDVQQLVGHKSLQTTQAYIEGSNDAKRKLVDMI
jgi:integrase/recombinase XerC